MRSGQNMDDSSNQQNAVQAAPDAKSLSRALYDDKKAVSQLQSRLSESAGQRGRLVRELRQVRTEFAEAVVRVRELKALRDKETASVKELKAKRQEANEALKIAVGELRKASEVKEAAVSVLGKSRPKNARGRAKSPEQLTAEIAELELRIETEVMPFEKEQQLMKVIKERKRQVDSSKSFLNASTAWKDAFAKFSGLRKESNSFHRELQQHAASSQKFHGEMVLLIPKLKELRKRREALAGQLGKAKEELDAADASLQQKLHNLAELREQLDTAAAAKQKEMEAKKREQAEKKEQELTEKLKSGKKLTLKDLIMLQGR
ncbi:hypothetical protein HYU17_01615 [Candidatus Woesearchaeota archaeon]|nr:hypothetical protein [Candidatus Woesearchaeota archaeon]